MSLIPTTNGTSRSAPLQNNASCSGCTPRQVLQFSSASEMIEYKKRQTTSQYYTNPSNMFPQKNRYASMYTTFKKAEAVKTGADKTCCEGGQLTPLSNTKDTPYFLQNKFNPT